MSVCLYFCLCVHSGRISLCVSLNPSSRLFLSFSLTRQSLSMRLCLSTCLHLPCGFSVFLGLGLRLSRPCWAQAIRLRVHPLYLMIPGTVGCSYAFMLPVSTPPNSIAFASGHLLVKDMVSLGIFSQRSGEVGGHQGWHARHQGRTCASPNILQFLNRSFRVGPEIYLLSNTLR